MRRKILVLGPLPPPFGGVSLHIVRFLELLKSEGVRAAAYPYTGTTRAGRLAKALEAAHMVATIYLRVRTGSDTVLHVHYGGLGYFLALAPLLATSRARLVVTFHSVRVLQDLERAPDRVRRLVMGLLARFALFVAVRAEIGEALRETGLSGPEITVMPAFLPPSPAEMMLDRLPPEVAGALTAAHDAGELQVCCAAYNLGRGYGHDDIYGIEALLAALANRRSPSARRLHLWVLVSNPPHGQEQLMAQSRIMGLAQGISQFTLHLHYGLPLTPVMCRTSAFLRPSREDGDSVAIREALALGVPVLASSVVNRPVGVETCSSEDLSEALGPFLDQLAPLTAGQIQTPGRIVEGVYREFVGKVLGETAAK